MKYNRLLISVSLLLLTGIYLHGQDVSETRNYSKSFLVSSNMKLDVSNKYGTVNLSRSKNDSVSMRVEIKVSSSSRSKLRSIIDGVSVDMNSTRYYITGRTNFSGGKIGFLEVIRKITNNLISSESRLEVNWWVSVPEGIPVEIENRYGDIFIGSLDNDLRVSLSNGSLQAEDLFGDTWFKLDFFDARFNMLQKSDISASYGDIDINTAGEVNFKTVSSRIEIKNIDVLSCNSKRDKFFIKEVSAMTGESFFTDFDLGILDRTADLTTRYGSFRVDNPGDKATLIKLITNFTAVRLNINPAGSYNFDLKTDKSNIYVPDSLNLEETSLSEDSEVYFYTGTFGNKPGLTRIMLDMTRGSLSINENFTPETDPHNNPK